MQSHISISRTAARSLFDDEVLASSSTFRFFFGGMMVVLVVPQRIWEWWIELEVV
jgi:hypothetical protein